ncbi:hypothetical protein [Caballeronia sordidicola]|nr:hypothetical protein [Caballeronia sordidicola]
MTTETNGAVLLDDGQYFVQHNVNYPATAGNGFLMRRCCYGLTTPEGRNVSVATICSSTASGTRASARPTTNAQTAIADGSAASIIASMRFMPSGSIAMRPSSDIRAIKAMTATSPSYTYEIKPRRAELGGGWQARFFEADIEIGGGAFPANADADPQAGIDWWNGLTEDERLTWMGYANSAKPRDAWQANLQKEAYDAAQNAAESWLESRERQ